MSRISEIIDHAKEIQKLIEKNDPDERLDWLSEVYSSADDIETYAKNLQEVIKNFVVELED